MAKSERNYVFDLLRIFACFMVIINHTNSWIFTQYFPSPSGKVSLGLFFISKTGVPIFLMISGALLLGKRDSYRVAYGKRAFRMVVDIVVFSLLTKCLIEENLSAFSLEFLRSLINEPCIVAYWYLYTYLSLMLMLPFFQRMVAGMSKKDFGVLLGVLFLFKQILPFLSVLEIPVSTSSFFNTNFFSGAIFYFLLGYFITHYFVDWVKSDKKRMRNIIVGSVVLFVTGILLCWYMTSLEYYQDGYFTLVLDNVYNFPITVYSTALFVFALLIFNGCRMPEKLSGFICVVGQATFGVYLIHNAVIYRTRWILKDLCANMNDLLAVLIMDILIFTFCTIIIVLVRKIRIMKKIL